MGKNCILSVFFVFFLTQLQANSLKEIKEEINDSMITAKITAQFTEKRNLNPLKIFVATDHGIVTLRGNVPDKNAYVDALRIAKKTRGVQSINSHDLYIKKVNTAFTDAFITAEVETAVLKAKVFDDESIPLVGINATTTNGVVTLSGTVANGQSIAAIIKRVNAIGGVKKIITHLQIKEDV